MPTKNLILYNIGQLLTMRHPRPTSLAAFGPRRGPDLNDVGLVEDAAVLCIGGKIAAAGREREVLRAAEQHKRLEELDCAGGVVLPGFVDSHTHPVFASPRLVDFEKRIAGATYEQIAAAGGGIRSSVTAVRKATRKQLTARVHTAFTEMLEQGTTTVEAKSGYGLTTESEIKSLQAIRDAAAEWPGTVVPTLLGAHVVPAEMQDSPDEYVREVCGQMIPKAAMQKLAQYVDVFCERGAFTLEQSERILRAAAENGLGTRAHLCQFTEARLEKLLQFAPASLDHMDCVHDDDLAALAQSQTIVTLLPAANYFLGHAEFPRARRLIDAGVGIALATDYNPGTAPTPSMPFVISLACTHMKMTPAEAIAASTINAAHALRLGDRKGTVEAGKDADLALFAVDDHREIPYWIATNRCAAVVAGGRVYAE